MRHIPEAKRERLMLECDRIEAELKEVDGLLKAAQARCAAVSSSAAASKNFLPSGKREEEQSVEKIKGTLGVDAKKLKRSHEMLEEETTKRAVRMRVRCLDVYDVVELSGSDLDAKADAYAWLVGEISSRVQQRTARVVTFSRLETPGRSACIHDLNSLLETFSSFGDWAEQVFRATDAVVTRHASVLDCFDTFARQGGGGSGSGKAAGEESPAWMFRSILKRTGGGGHESTLCIRHVKRIPKSFFECIRYRAALVHLDLRGCGFLLDDSDLVKVASEAISTLPELESLNVSFPGHASVWTRATRVGAVHGFLEKLNLPRLALLDVSGVQFLDGASFRATQSLGDALEALIRRHASSLRDLRMDACLNVPRGTPLSDDECDALHYVVTAIANGIAAAGLSSLVRFRFGGNAIVDSSDAHAMKRFLGHVHGELDLRSTRTWSPFDDEEEASAEDEGNGDMDGNNNGAFEETMGLGQALNVWSANPAHPASAHHLTELNLSGCSIRDVGLKALANGMGTLHGLRVLNVDSVGATGEGLRALFLAICALPQHSLDTMLASDNHPHCFSVSGSDSKPATVLGLLWDVLTKTRIGTVGVMGYEGLLLPSLLPSATGAASSTARVEQLLVSVSSASTSSSALEQSMEALFASLASLKRVCVRGWTKHSYHEGDEHDWPQGSVFTRETCRM